MIKDCLKCQAKVSNYAFRRADGMQSHQPHGLVWDKWDYLPVTRLPVKC